MIKFELNGSTRAYAGDPGISLLSYLRDGEGITSVKDGCSGQAACGACLLEMNCQPVLACVTPMRKVSGAKVVTIPNSTHLVPLEQPTKVANEINSFLRSA